MDPGLVILKEFLLENVMVRCLGDQMNFWLGGKQKYVSWSISRVLGWVMCGFWCFGGLGGRQVT